MKWFFLNIITCVIDFFAMASPGCFSCADLFSPDCVCVALRRGTPAGSGSSSSFVPHGLISSGCLGRGMWHFIHLHKVLELDQCHLHVPAELLHRYREANNWILGLKEWSGCSSSLPPSKWSPGQLQTCLFCKLFPNPSFESWLAPSFPFSFREATGICTRVCHQLHL